MQLIDNGRTKPEALFTCFKQDTDIITADHESGYDFALIANHQGSWTVAFNGVPRVEYLQTIVKFFARHQSDSLEILIYNYRKSDEAIFANQAGCFKGSADIYAEPLTYIINHLGLNKTFNKG